MTKRPVSFRLEQSKITALDQIAQSVASNRNHLLAEAVENYLEFHQWQIDQIQEGIREAGAGKLIDHTVHFPNVFSTSEPRASPETPS